MTKSLKPFSNSNGATVLEFSIALILLFSLMGAVFDFGLAYHRYNMLNYVASKVAREFSASVVNRPYDEACSDLYHDMRERSFEVYNEQFGIPTTPAAMGDTLDPHSNNGDFQLDVLLAPRVSVDSELPRRLQVTADMRLDCFFCVMFPKGIILSTGRELELEDSDYDCL